MNNSIWGSISSAFKSVLFESWTTAQEEIIQSSDTPLPTLPLHTASSNSSLSMLATHATKKLKLTSNLWTSSDIIHIYSQGGIIPLNQFAPRKIMQRAENAGKLNEVTHDQFNISNQDEDVLCRAFENTMNLRNMAKQRNDEARNEVAKVYRNTEEIYGCLKSEADRQLKILTQYDPNGPAIQTCKELLLKASSLMQQRIPIDRSWKGRIYVPHGHNGRNDVDYVEILRKANVRYSIIKQNLMDAISILLPAIEDCERRHILVNNRHLTRQILVFLPLQDLCACASVSKCWKQIIQTNCLVSSSMNDSEQRWACWWHCISNKNLLLGHKIFNFNYSLLVSQSSSSNLVNHELIERDISRTTFIRAEHIYSKREHLRTIRIGSTSDVCQNEMKLVRSLQSILSRILKAFAFMDQSTGYCQGMTFIGAMIMSCLNYDEEKSYDVFVNLMHSYKMNEMFRNGLSGARLRCYQLHQLIKIHIPDLFVCLDGHHILPMMYASGWMMTFFTNEITLPPNVMVKLFDTFVQSGWPGAFQIYLGLLSAFKGMIKLSRYEKSLQALIKLPKLLGSENVRIVFEKAATFHVDENILDELEVQYRAHES